MVESRAELGHMTMLMDFMQGDEEDRGVWKSLPGSWKKEVPFTKTESSKRRTDSAVDGGERVMIFPRASVWCEESAEFPFMVAEHV